MGFFSRMFDSFRAEYFVPNSTIRLTDNAIIKYLPDIKPSLAPLRTYDYLDDSSIEKLHRDNMELFNEKAVTMASGDSNDILTKEYLNKLSFKSMVRTLDFGNEQDESDYQQLIKDYKPQQDLLLDLFKPDNKSLLSIISNHIIKEPLFEPIFDFGRQFHGGSGIDIFITSKPDTYYEISNLSDKNQIILKYPDQSDHSNPFLFPTLGSRNPNLDFGDQKVSYNLYDIERVQFSNKNLAFDLKGNAGIVAKVYGAVLGKEALLDKELISSGLKAVDDGLNAENFATLVLKSTGLESHTDIVNDLWFNVAGYKPTVEEMQPFINQLDSGEKSIGDLVLYAANYSLNEANIDLVGLVNHGIEFV